MEDSHLLRRSELSLFQCLLQHRAAKPCTEIEIPYGETSSSTKWPFTSEWANTRLMGTCPGKIFKSWGTTQPSRYSEWFKRSLQSPLFVLFNSEELTCRAGGRNINA